MCLQIREFVTREAWHWAYCSLSSLRICCKAEASACADTRLTHTRGNLSKASVHHFLSPLVTPVHKSTAAEQMHAYHGRPWRSTSRSQEHAHAPICPTFQCCAASLHASGACLPSHASMPAHCAACCKAQLQALLEPVPLLVGEHPAVVELKAAKGRGQHHASTWHTQQRGPGKGGRLMLVPQH